MVHRKNETLTPIALRCRGRRALRGRPDRKVLQELQAQQASHQSSSTVPRAPSSLAALAAADKLFVRAWRELSRRGLALLYHHGPSWRHALLMLLMWLEEGL